MGYSATITPQRDAATSFADGHDEVACPAGDNPKGKDAKDRRNNKWRDLRWGRLLTCRLSNDRLDAYPTDCSAGSKTAKGGFRHV